MSWLIAREGDVNDPDCEPFYMLMEIGSDGNAEIFVQGEPLEKIQRIKSALEWQDTLGEGRMSLAQEGITFNANTGKIWKAPKSRRGIGIKIEPASKPSPRKKTP